MKLTDVPLPDIVEAVEYSGVLDVHRNIERIASDFKSDRYWNDPKCVRRRILAEGGDPVRFFTAPSLQINWGN